MKTKVIIRVSVICLLLVLLASIASSCGKRQNALRGLIYSDHDGLQTITQEGVNEIVKWSSLDSLCDPVALSPDGRKVAYTHTGRDLWIMDLVSGDSTEVLKESVRAEHADIIRMSWSPDGDWLALLVGRIYEGRPEPELVTLFTVEVNGDHTVEMASGVADYAWLPDSGRIAYLMRYTQGEGGIYVAQPDGEETRLVITGLSFAPFLIASSQDDLVAAIAYNVTEDHYLTLLMVNVADGSSVDLLQNFPRDYSQTLSWPAWSPDGTRVAFLSCVPVAEEPLACSFVLFVVDVTEGSVQEIISGGIDGPLVWSPDGKEIAFEWGADKRHVYHVLLENKTVAEWVDAHRCGRLFEWR